MFKFVDITGRIVELEFFEDIEVVRMFELVDITGGIGELEFSDNIGVVFVFELLANRGI
jgi:hypothetical protein